jgi:hypothetical protein
MCDWMAACAELVSPVWERMEVVLTSRAVQTDDTPVQVLEEASPYAHRPDLDVCGGSQTSLHRLRLHGQS